MEICRFLLHTLFDMAYTILSWISYILKQSIHLIIWKIKNKGSEVYLLSGSVHDTYTLETEVVFVYFLL
jgi:hypothetical protein